MKVCVCDVCQTTEELAEDPFAHIKPGAMTNPERQFFVSHEMTMKVIECCPNTEWRLIVALSRFGGLRCPSEHQALGWRDINWECGRFTVRSPKTGDRVVPIFPELLPFLRAAFEEAEEGAVNVITKHRDREANLRTRLTKIIRAAGLERWERPFHNLRASRQTELEQAFPSHVVCNWLGNSEATARKHYLTVREEDFTRATSHALGAAINRFTGFRSEQTAMNLEPNDAKSGVLNSVTAPETDEYRQEYPRRDSNGGTISSVSSENDSELVQKALQVIFNAPNLDDLDAGDDHALRCAEAVRAERAKGGAR